MKKIQLFTLFILLFQLNTWANWTRNVINYTPNNYNLGNQNWDIDQSDKGWMYFANSKGLLEYDGINWTSYPVHHTMVRAVKCLGNRIYVGGSSEFGYFEPDARGGLQYICLSDSLKDWGGEIWDIHITNDEEVFFRSEYSIVHYSKGMSTPIWGDIKIESSVIFDNKLYCGTNNGMYYLKGDKLIFIAGTKNLQNKRIIKVIPYQDQLLLVSNRDGIYYFDGTKAEKSSLSNLDFVENNQLFCAAICDSTLALGSIQNGIYIVNLKNNTYENYSLTNQLQNNTILKVKFDSHKDLWLGLDKGIDYINLQSPILSLFGNKSLIGSGYSSAFFNNMLYLATNQGIFTASYTKNNSYNLSDIKCITGTEGQSWCFLKHDNKLFCANDNGVFVFDKGSMKRINVSGVWQLRMLDEHTLLGILYNGLIVIKKQNNEWTFSHRVNTSDGFWGLLPDEQPNTFWVIRSNMGIVRLKLSDNLRDVTNLEIFDASKGISLGDNWLPRLINNRIVFCLREGIYYYNRLNNKIEPYPELENTLAGHTVYDFLYQDSFGNIWFVVNGKLKMLRAAGNHEDIIDYGFKNMLIKGYEHINMIDEWHAMVATIEGFSIIDLQSSTNSNLVISPFIKQVISTNSTNQNQDRTWLKESSLPFSQNSLRFEFGASDYTKDLEITYSYRLKGHDKDWSIPSTTNTKEYTSIYEGDYTFEVRVYVNGNLSPHTATFSFSISPPWYRTIWAYLTYSLLIGLGFYAFYKISVRKQKKVIAQKKQEIVDERKRHLEETVIKDKEIDELLNEKLKSELDFKNQQLNSSTLNVIRKNEMLLSIKKNAQNISKSIDENGDLKSAKRKIIQLIGQIDTNIEHDEDFQSFISNFDRIHQGFYKKLESKFPLLTKNDKLLCAYIKMDLSSKEIAPLLNISFRGVEISRYRLRKKMNLVRDDNFSDFLKNL